MTRRERLTRRLERRQEWATKAQARSERRFDAAHQLADSIPLGQPILVGHHSEGRARRDAQRIEDNMYQGCQEHKLAEHHESKAAGLASQLDRSVFSDDDDAIEQLRARIATNEAKRDRMKLINTLYKKGDAAGLAALGIDLAQLKAKLAGAGSYWGSKPHLPYELTNIGAAIRKDRERIAEVQARLAGAEKAEQAGGVVIEGGEWVRVTFAEKPSRPVLDALKAAGFRWGAGSWGGKREHLPACVRDLATGGETAP